MSTNDMFKLQPEKIPFGMKEKEFWRNRGESLFA